MNHDPRICRSPESGTGRHVVGAENVDPFSPLHGICLACRRSVIRAHKKSAHWYATEDMQDKSPKRTEP